MIWMRRAKPTMTPDPISSWANAGESAMRVLKTSTEEKERACRMMCAFFKEPH